MSTSHCERYILGKKIVGQPEMSKLNEYLVKPRLDNIFKPHLFHIYPHVNPKFPPVGDFDTRGSCTW